MSGSRDGRGDAVAGGTPARRAERDLRRVNDGLRDLIESLRSEHGRRAAALRGDAPWRGSAGEPAAEERGAAGSPDPARAGLEHQSRELEELRRRLVDIERDHRRACDEVAAAQAQGALAAGLYAALARLHGTLERREVLTAIQEIVINLLGSEELAIYEAAPDGARLALASSFGSPPAGVEREIAVGQGVIGRAAADGRIWTAGRSAERAADDPHLTACVPLKLGAKLVGAVAVYRLLGHKHTIGQADQELLEVLAQHAAIALHLTGLQERDARGRA